MKGGYTMTTDVVRDIQDIVAGDAGLTALAHQGNHSGFQQVSFLLTDPAPFPIQSGMTCSQLTANTSFRPERTVCFHKRAAF